jgi:hypothetical protein
VWVLAKAVRREYEYVQKRIVVSAAVKEQLAFEGVEQV